MSTEWESDFRAALSQSGVSMSPDERLQVDDRVHRYRASDDKEADAWYALHSVPSSDGNGFIVVGAYGHWSRLPSVAWCSRQKNNLSKEEWSNIARAQKDIAQRRADDEKAVQEAARKKLSAWLAFFPKCAFHLYLSTKGVEPCGDIREFSDELYRGWLCLPLRDITGTAYSAQFISDEGDKKFLYGGRVKGCFFQVSEVAGGPIIICEGYATGATIYAATGWTVACAMNCGNLQLVVQSFRQKYPDRTILIAADNDQYKEDGKNPGVDAAIKAAASVKNCLVAIPEFASEALAEQPTDFNDLQQIGGLDSVRTQIYSAFPVLKILEDRRYDPNARPPEMRPIYTCQYKIICTPGNLTTITSGIKTGKTATVGGMISSAMTNGDENIDNLSFKSQNPDARALLHFDSEQSPDDHWFAVDRIIRRSRMDRAPNWFYSYCLTGLGAKLAWDCVKQAHAIAAERHGGLHSVFTDGAADLVADVNDPEECNARVAELHDLAIQYEYPHVTVIHFNPNSEKSRGHLGSQLERKAETNLALEKDKNEITRIYSVKNRRAGIPKNEGPCFRYDPDAGMHVTCEAPADAKGGAPNKAAAVAAMNLAEFLSVTPEYGESRNAASIRLLDWLGTQAISMSRSTAGKVLDLLIENRKLRILNMRYYKGPNA